MNVSGSPRTRTAILRPLIGLIVFSITTALPLRAEVILQIERVNDTTGIVSGIGSLGNVQPADDQHIMLLNGNNLFTKAPTNGENVSIFGSSTMSIGDRAISWAVDGAPGVAKWSDPIVYFGTSPYNFTPGASIAGSLVLNLTPGTTWGSIGSSGTLYWGVYPDPGRTIIEGTWQIVGPSNPCRSSNPLFFQQNVTISPGDTDMSASFVSNQTLRGCSLSDIAAAYGYDHFNWVQTIDHYDGLLLSMIPPGVPIHAIGFPILDPLPGGYFPAHPADLKPFYWDEVSVLPDFYLWNPGNMTDYVLNFIDKPKSRTIYESDEYMSFITSLVGVRGDDTWDPLATFTWKSNYNGDTGGTYDVTSDLTPPVGGLGGIYDVNMLSDPWAVPQPVRELWVANGANVVPTPATLFLLLAGLAAMVPASRRISP